MEYSHDAKNSYCRVLKISNPTQVVFNNQIGVYNMER